MDYSKGGGQGAASCGSLAGVLQSPHFLCSYDMSFVVPRVNGYGKARLLYTGICLWNNLPLSVQQCRTKSMFKNHVKKFLWDKIDAVHQNVYTDRF